MLIMMGSTQRRQGQLFYTGLSLDDRIAADDPLRRIREVLDFSFVRPAVAHVYGETGNPSVDPIVLLKLMLIFFLENVPSERKLMARLPSRLDWLWFCEYDFDSVLPNHSVLSKARRRWGPAVFGKLFERILTQCVEAGLVDGEVMHIDSSLIDADASLETLRPAFAVLADETYRQMEATCDVPAEKPTVDDVGEDSSSSGDGSGNRLPNPGDGDAPIASNDPLARPGTKLSETDLDARARIKGSQKVFGYQEHRCTDDAHGIITATETTDAAVHEGDVLEAMVDRHEQAVGQRPENVVADKAYGRMENYVMLKDRGILPCVPHPDHTRKPKGKFSRDDFTYDRRRDCYTCPGGQTLTRQTVHPDKVGQSHYYKTGRGVCQRCPLGGQCYDGEYEKRIRRHVHQDIMDWADTCLPRSQRRHLTGRRRAVAEGSFADATNNHGYKRARWRRRWRVEIQNLLIASLQNLRKLISALNRPKRRIAASAAVLAARIASWNALTAFDSPPKLT
jgi:transposase